MSYQSASDLAEIKNVSQSTYLLSIDTSEKKPKIRRLKLSRLEPFLNSGTPRTVDSSVYNTQQLNKGQTEQGLITIANSAIITHLHISSPAWVRVYANSSFQANDRQRLISDDPAGNHGVLLEASSKTSNLALELSPKVPVAHAQNSTEVSFPISITGLSEILNPVAITFDYIIL